MDLRVVIGWMQDSDLGLRVIGMGGQKMKGKGVFQVKKRALGALVRFRIGIRWKLDRICILPDLF